MSEPTLLAIVEMGGYPLTPRSGRVRVLSDGDRADSIVNAHDFGGRERDRTHGMLCR